MPRKQAPAVEPRVYGYCRCSTAEQTEGVSLDEQQRRIRGRALELGVELTRIFVEEGVRARPRSTAGRRARSSWPRSGPATR